MIIQLQEYNRGEARAFEVNSKKIPDVVTCEGRIWKYDSDQEEGGQMYHFYERATTLEIEPL